MIGAIAGHAVHLSITPHGLEGPLAGVPGNNLTACARTGWCSINGRRDEPPLQLPSRQTGYIAGVAGFVGAAAALLRSRLHGAGERVDVSEIEALALTNAPWAILGLFMGGNLLAHGPAGGARRGAPGPLWETADGLINFGYGDWAKWREAMLFLGRQNNYPVALEGALKLKEISYIYASGHASAELKHGIIALVKPELPSVAARLSEPVIFSFPSRSCSPNTNAVARLSESSI